MSYTLHTPGNNEIRGLGVGPQGSCTGRGEGGVCLFGTWSDYFIARASYNYYSSFIPDKKQHTTVLNLLL